MSTLSAFLYNKTANLRVKKFTAVTSASVAFSVYQLTRPISLHSVVLSHAESLGCICSGKFASAVSASIQIHWKWMGIFVCTQSTDTFAILNSRVFCFVFVIWVNEFEFNSLLCIAMFYADWSNQPCRLKTIFLYYWMVLLRLHHQGYLLILISSIQRMRASILQLVLM